MASFLIKDKAGHVYPARSKRLAPDFFFQDQVYRNSYRNGHWPFSSRDSARSQSQHRRFSLM
jgi:hypothetical protein